MSRNGRIAGALMMVCLVAGNVAGMREGRADNWRHMANVRVATEYETNPAMEDVHPRGVWKAIFDPGYTLMGRIGESEISTGLAVQFIRSSNKALSPDRDSPTAFLDWRQPGETDEFGISARYAEVATRDAGGVDASLPTPSSSTNVTRTMSGNWRHELGERSTFTADAAYEGVAYKESTNIDHSSRSGSVNMAYDLSEQTTSFIQLSGNRLLTSGGGANSSLVVATAGMNWQGESWNWVVQAGRARFEGHSDLQGSIETRYTGPRSQLTLNAGRSVLPGGSGAFVKTDHAGGSWRYALGEYTDVGTDMNRQKNLATDIRPSATSALYGMWLEHDLASAWSMRAYVQHRTAQDGNAGRITSNMLGLSMTYVNQDF